LKRYSPIYIILTKGGVIIYYNEALLKQLRSGNKNAEEELIRQNTPLVYRLVKDYYYACKEPEDMKDIFQAGCLGLIKAMKNYDFSYENKFVTYAYYFIRGEARRAHEGLKKRELTISDVSMVMEEGVGVESNEDIFEYIRKGRRDEESEWNTYDSVIDKVLVEEMLEKVTPVQKKILIYRYFDDLSQKEISEILGLHQVYVSREEKKARDKMLSLLMTEDCTL